MSKADDKSDDKLPIKDTDELLAELAEDATQIVSNSETLEKMAKAGIKFDRKPPVSNEDYIDRLFEARKQKAPEIIKQFPPPPEIALPPITSLYTEIRECILFGLNGAAITLSAILVEFALKHAIIDHKTGITEYSKEEWDRLENIELGPVIKEAFELKVISEESRKELNKFRKDVRNLYLHYNIKKITSSAVMQEAARLDVSTGEIVIEKNLRAEDHPFIWQLAKKKMDEASVMNIFSFADSVVKSLFHQQQQDKKD